MATLKRRKCRSEFAGGELELREIASDGLCTDALVQIKQLKEQLSSWQTCPNQSQMP
jgi:hypothetical protein